MEAEHANVPIAHPAFAGPTRGILANSATGKGIRKRVAEHANVPIAHPAFAGPMRGILANSATGKESAKG
jgi:small neutral amino acid transporter SnatA (MarC family)